MPRVIIKATNGMFSNRNVSVKNWENFKMTHNRKKNNTIGEYWISSRARPRSRSPPGMKTRISRSPPRRSTQSPPPRRSIWNGYFVNGKGIAGLNY